MNRRYGPVMLLAAVLFAAGALWWLSEWKKTGPTPASGGMIYPGRLELKVPHFWQMDPRWKDEPLGSTPATLGEEGCAVSSAAMVLAAYGIDVDPGRLNSFLSRHPKGYTDRGWIYWESAAEYDPEVTPRLLPHYESLPSHRIIDKNLMFGNPVIARVRLSSGLNHFVVICGKEGFDYLIRDPAVPSERGVYPLKDLAKEVDAIRYYRRP